MEGVDRDWNYVNADRRYTVYAGLPSGNYIFDVKASNNDGLWNNNGTSLRIIILPPWWQTLWFRISLFLMVVACVIVFYKLRTYKIKKRNLELEQHVMERTSQLETAHKDLETFTYSIAHDLRSPLRGIDGFSQILLEEYHNKIDAQGREYLARIRNATQLLAQFIDSLSYFSHVSRSKLTIQPVNLSDIVHNIADILKESNPKRQVEFVIQKGITGNGDSKLLRIVLDNLIWNAWKFTSHHSKARIEFGLQMLDGKQVYFVKDDGAGFNMQYSHKLFGFFQRLHSRLEFPGIGLGLAVVQSIIHRHGGDVWANSEVEKGATFCFTLPGNIAKQNIN